MQTVSISPGMKVQDIRDRTVGTVMRVNACCFEVKRPDESVLALNSASLLGSDNGRIELICDASELERYACGMHSKQLRQVRP